MRFTVHGFAGRPGAWALLVVFAVAAGGCVTLTPQQQDTVADVQRFADATTAAYDLPRIRVTIEPATNLGIGGHYRQGNFYLNVRMLDSGNLTAVVAHELAHYVLGHDALLPGASMGEFQRMQEQRELDANAKAVEILVRVKGLTQRQAVKIMVIHLKGAQAVQERGGARTWGHRAPIEEIEDLLARFPDSPAEPRSVEQAPPPTRGPLPPPIWRPGDQWTYWWEAPQGAGTFIWSVDREETVEGIEDYVIKSNTQHVEVFYRKSDLAGHMNKAGGEVDTRYTPPEIRFAWPLAVGAEWEQTVTRERVKARTTETSTRSCRVESEETLTVTAGRFRALKTVCRDKQTNQPIYQIWYSPEVKSWIRDWRAVPGGALERELLAYKLR